MNLYHYFVDTELKAWTKQVLRVWQAPLYYGLNILEFFQFFFLQRSQPTLHSGDWFKQDVWQWKDIDSSFSEWNLNSLVYNAIHTINNTEDFRNDTGFWDD